MVEGLPHFNRPARPAQTTDPSVRSRFSVRPHQGTPDFAALTGKVAHLWAGALDLPVAQLDAFCEFLSESERERSARFHFELHRNRYIASHGYLRLVLSKYLAVSPAQVQFQQAQKGKPFLAPQYAQTELQFSLAHSDDLALIGVAWGVPIGVDLERVRELDDAEELVHRFFSKRESTAFQALPKSQKALAFFNLWTRKEAWLKATGEGIAHLLNQVEVSFVPGEPARLLGLPASYSTGLWSIQDVDIGQDFVAAVAIAVDHVRPELYWTTQLNPIGL